MRYAIAFLCIAGPACAQDYEMRATDEVATQEVLFDLILDQDLEYYDGGVSRYRSDGTYSWTYAENNGGGVWTGTYVFTDAKQMCVTFDAGPQRCDVFVINAGGLVLLTDDGERYPLRAIR